MKLAIAQMVFGGLITGNCVWVWWVSNTWVVPPMMRVFYKLPFLAIFLMLGLAVLGCGIAQYLKARG